MSGADVLPEAEPHERAHDRAAGHPHDHARDRCLLQEVNSQILPVHAALLRTGKLLYFSGSGNDPAKFDRPMETRIWDPTEGAVRKITRIDPHRAQRDLFCTGHCFLPDGRLLVAGGNAGYPRSERFPVFTGIRDTFAFDPERGREVWRRAAVMSHGRWYPTCVALPDGTVVVLSGVWDGWSMWRCFVPPWNLITSGRFNNRCVEAWSADGGLTALADQCSGHWTNLHANRAMAYYPRVHLVPSGELLRVGPERKTMSFDPTSHRWRAVARSGQNRFEGTSVFLPLRPPKHEARILALGGSNSARNIEGTNSASVLEFMAGAWRWRWVGPMTFRRVHVNATLLLDGRVLVTGGGVRGKVEPVLETELFDPRPDHETWTQGATCSVGRTYHSVAVLLPDGRVWTGGGNPAWGDDELRIELYTPDYCGEDNGSDGQGSLEERPSIDAYPPAVAYGSPFEVRVDSPTPILEVALVRPSSVTHSFNVDQRWVGLEILSVEGRTLEVRAPPRPELAPPGWYLLTALDEHRCPAPAQWVRLHSGN